MTDMEGVESIRPLVVEQLVRNMAAASNEGLKDAIEVHVLAQLAEGEPGTFTRLEYTWALQRFRGMTPDERVAASGVDAEPGLRLVRDEEED